MSASVTLTHQKMLLLHNHLPHTDRYAHGHLNMFHMMQKCLNIHQKYIFRYFMTLELKTRRSRSSFVFINEQKVESSSYEIMITQRTRGLESLRTWREKRWTLPVLWVWHQIIENSPIVYDKIQKWRCLPLSFTNQTWEQPNSFRE